MNRVSDLVTTLSFCIRVSLCIRVLLPLIGSFPGGELGADETTNPHVHRQMITTGYVDAF